MKRTLQFWLAALFTVLPFVVFWLCWDHLAVNVPKWDDHALKAYLYYSEREPTLSGKLALFFGQHNEHRIVLDRFATVVDFALFGKLNYRHLMLLGNLSLLGLLVLFGAVLRQNLSEYRSGRTINARETSVPWLIYMPPAAFLLFNLSSWENAFWGMAALQNFSVVLWVLWSVYRLSFSRGIAGAIVLAVLATLTSGNGLLIWPIGLVLLGLQRRFRHLGIWAFSAALVVGLYFLGYAKPKGNPPARGSVTEFVKGWLAFQGAAAEVFPVGTPFVLCLLVGGILAAVILLSAAWILVRHLRPVALNQPARAETSHPESNRTDYFYLGAVAFLLGTTTIVTWTRVGFGLDLLITSRYKIYSLTLLILVYVFAVGRLTGRPRQLLGLAGWAGGLLIAGLSYLTYADEVLWWRRWQLTNQYNWTYLGDRPVSGIDPATARWIDNAPAYYDRCLSAIYKPTQGQSVALDSVREAGTQYVINSTDPNLSDFPQPTLQNPDAGLTVLLQSAQRTYLYGALPSPAGNARTAWQRGLFPAHDLLSNVPVSEPDPGVYKLSVLAFDPVTGSCQIRPTNRSMTIRPRATTQINKNW